MRLVNVAPIAVTVELSIPDCITLFAACAYAADDSNSDVPYALTEALGTALLGHALAAEFLAQNDPPHTLRGMWARWAPLNEQVEPARQIGIPPWLPLGQAE